MALRVIPYFLHRFTTSVSPSSQRAASRWDAVTGFWPAAFSARANTRARPVLMLIWSDPFTEGICFSSRSTSRLNWASSTFRLFSTNLKNPSGWLHMADSRWTVVSSWL